MWELLPPTAWSILNSSPSVFWSNGRRPSQFNWRRDFRQLSLSYISLLERQNCRNGRSFATGMSIEGCTAPPGLARPSRREKSSKTRRTGRLTNPIQDRLRDHAKAFDGLLSLIPAKMYYGEDTSVRWRSQHSIPASPHSRLPLWWQPEF